MDYGINGIISSFIATSFIYPIDTLKTKKQAGISFNFSYKNIPSLYKGIRPELLSCIPSSFTYWFTYQKCRENNMSTTYSSLVSCITSNIIDTPFDIIKKKNQLSIQSSQKPLLKYGICNTLSSCIYNIFYLNTLKYIKDTYNTPNYIAISAACNVSGLLSYPLDRYKTILLYPEASKISYIKGLGYRLLYSNLYSGLYMNIFLWLTNNSIL